MALILVIDDDVQIRAMLTRMLEGEGYGVLAAADGEEGLRRFKESPADLILTDIVMPEKDGMETIMEIRREYPEVKIIAMSGGGRVGPFSYLMMAKRLGAEEVLTKPLKKARLMEAIQSLLAE